jgi:type III restriction enzyme
MEVAESDWCLGSTSYVRFNTSRPHRWAYAKNHNLGLEVPYRYGSETRRYLPDFIGLVDDGHGEAAGPSPS